MKRFWDTASPAPSGCGWSVLLDGKPVRLPGGAPLHLLTGPLAEAVAAEWQAAGGAKGGQMDMADLPLTRLAGTVQERVAPDPEPVVQAIATYADSDLLCYRAEHPAALVQRQATHWQPWLDWAAEKFGARLRCTHGLMPIIQDADATAALAAAAARQTPPVLAALGLAVSALGSIVLGLAIAEDALGADAAFDLSALDERFQAEQWGEDAEAAARRGRMRADILLAGRFMALSRA